MEGTNEYSLIVNLKNNMTILKTKVKMNLVGIDGNAFSIMGAFSKNAKKQGVPQADIDSVLKDAQSGDYDNLLRVMIGNTESVGEDGGEDY